MSEPTRSVWKYDVLVNDNAHMLTMPAPARVMHVACQRPGVVTLWAEVTPGSPDESVALFQVFGTGHEVRGAYVGTAFDREFVWHLYTEQMS